LQGRVRAGEIDQSVAFHAWLANTEGFEPLKLP
jgi:hypothetical protein